MNQNIEGKWLENMQNYQFLKVQNTPLELENNFLELKDREWKDRKQKIKREIENYFMS